MGQDIKTSIPVGFMDLGARGVCVRSVTAVLYEGLSLQKAASYPRLLGSEDVNTNRASTR